MEATMLEVNLSDLLLSMSASTFLLGMVTFLIGVFILITRAAGQDFRSITDQTARLVQKGVADEIAGLIGNANTLLKTMSDMVRTVAGVGVFLTLTGTVMMASSLLILLRLI
jgi:hypothetical protein